MYTIVIKKEDYSVKFDGSIAENSDDLDIEKETGDMKAVSAEFSTLGDIIAVSNAGSYSYTLSPQLFAGHTAPKQIVNQNRNTRRLVTQLAF